MQETQVRSLGWEDPLGKELATYSSNLAWKIPWTKKPGRYSPWSCKELDTTEQLTLVMKQSESEGHSVVSDTLRSHGLYSPWNSPGQNTGMGSLSLLQGIFATQGSNPGLTHSLQVDSLPAEPQGKPKNTGVGSLSLLQGIFLTQDQTRVSCIAEGFLTKWAMRGATESVIKKIPTCRSLATFTGFYQIVKEETMSILLKLFQKWREGTFPKSVFEDRITLISKSDKEIIKKKKGQYHWWT